MNKDTSTKIYHNDNTDSTRVIPKYTGWDFVIEQGIKELAALEAMAAKIRISVEYFEKRRESGDPFPGEDRLRAGGLL